MQGTVFLQSLWPGSDLMGARERLHMGTNTTKGGGRDFSADRIRVLAFVLVPSVHFFLNSEYYSEPVSGMGMYLMTVVLTLCMTCVPLFLLLTGYLECSWEIPLSAQGLGRFYRKLISVYSIYLMVSVLVLLFRFGVRGERLGGVASIEAIFGFQHYSWYVEMYLGLALLIPFLNALWRSIRDRWGHRALLMVLLVLSVLPSVMDMTGHALLPDWWRGLYPVTYYCIGAYLREYDGTDAAGIRWIGRRSRPGRLFLFLGICVVLGGSYCVLRSRNGVYADGGWNDWGSLMHTVDAVLLFQLVRSLGDFGCSARGRRIWARLSSLTFAAYLLSWFPDQILYPVLIAHVPQMTLRLGLFLPVVLTSAGISLILAAVITPAAGAVSAAVLRGLKRFVKMLQRGVFK